MYLCISWRRCLLDAILSVDSADRRSWLGLTLHYRKPDKNQSINQSVYSRGTYRQ